VTLCTAGDGSAQAQEARVVPVVFLPADEPHDTARLLLQVQAVRDAQEWYAQRLNGMTFFADPVTVQRSSHAFAELAGDDFQNWWPLPAAEFAAWGMPWNDSSRIKLLLLAQGAGAWAGADSENGGIPSESEAGRSRAGHLGGLAVVGDSSIGGILAGVCPRAGEASWRKPEGGTEWWCNWNTYRGTVAHELGHTFGLPHPDAFRPGFRCDSTVIANMQCHWAWPADSLLPFEATHLRSLPVFGDSAAQLWLRADAETAEHADRIDFTRTGSVLWLDGRGRGTGYLWGWRASAGAQKGARIIVAAPTDARSFVVDAGWATGTIPHEPVTIRMTRGERSTERTLQPGAAPRTLRLEAANGTVTIEIRGGAPGDTVGFGHPRWERRSSYPAS
jgi:hypothetical protein